MTFNSICTFGNLTNEPKKNAQRVIASELIPVQSSYDERVLRKVQGIMLPIHSMNAIGSTAALEYDYALRSLAVLVSGSLLFEIPYICSMQLLEGDNC